MIELPKLVLASGSPRRSEILTSVGWPFEKIVPDVDESVRADEDPRDYVVRLAVDKANAVKATTPDRTILAADTTVVVDGEIIGKPVDLSDAAGMIEKLQGRWHEVLTGVALVVDGEVRSGVESTKVKFKAMNSAEIRFLVENGHPLDKAGAYAVQAEAALFIDGIEGDYWNVVGLPISLVYDLLNGKAR